MIETIKCFEIVLKNDQDTILIAISRQDLPLLRQKGGENLTYQKKEGI